MKKIREFVEENKKEAIEIVRSKGGRIDFVKVEDEDNFDVENADMENAAYIACECSDGSTANCAILAVKIYKDKLMFLAYDLELEDGLEWLGVENCAYLSENFVYEEIEKYA